MIERDKVSLLRNLVSKVEPLKPISCGHCGKTGHIITNCWRLGGETPCEQCGRFNHKSEDCLKVSLLNEPENSKGVKVKPLID